MAYKSTEAVKRWRDKKRAQGLPVHTPERLAKQSAWLKETYYEARHALYEIVGKECVGCGHTDIRVLEFDHIDNDGAARMAELRAMAIPIASMVVSPSFAAYGEPVFVCDLTKRPEVLTFLKEQAGKIPTVELDWEVHNPHFDPSRGERLGAIVFCLMRYNDLRFALAFSLDDHASMRQLSYVGFAAGFGLAALDEYDPEHAPLSIMRPARFPVGVVQLSELRQSIESIAAIASARILEKAKPWMN